jgi:AcrR family transcriptional regulator
MTVGRPRDPAVDEAILDATRQLLREQGYQRLSIPAAAARAGVTPPTVRLRWPTRAELVHDAVFRDLDDVPIPDTGSLEGDIDACVANTMAAYAPAEVQAAVVGVYGELPHQPDVARRLAARILDPVVEGLRQLVERAVARGEVRRDVDPRVLVEVMAGAVVMRMLAGGVADGQWHEELTALLLDGLRGPST